MCRFRKVFLHIAAIGLTRPSLVGDCGKAVNAIAALNNEISQHIVENM